MQALGNDFVVVDGQALASSESGRRLLRTWHKLAGPIARALCDRHFGVGGDGLIIALDKEALEELRSLEISELSRLLSSSGDIGWIYTNSDGSESDMCGNGLRCLALLAVRKGLVQTSEFVIATQIGPVSARFETEDLISIDLGQPKLSTELIPLDTKKQAEFVRQPLTIQPFGPKRELLVTCVGMGNPHCVVFGDYSNAPFASPELGALARSIQSNELFSEGVNVEFATVKSSNSVSVLVWERGCGPTLACASGAAATVIAGVLEKRLSRNCTVELPGGSIQIAWSDTNGHVVLTGSAREVFAGEIDLLKFESLRGLLAAEATCLQ